MRYNAEMIRSFGDGRTEALFQDRFVPDFQGIARRAKRKLEAINAASRLGDVAAATEPTGKAAWGSARLPLDPNKRAMARHLPMARW